MKHFNIIKLVFLTLVINLFMTMFCYAEDVRMQLLYGINNQAKDGIYLPIEVTFENRDSIEFDGYILAKVYENSDSVYKYRQDINIPKKSTIIKNMNISVSPRNNIIIVELYDFNDIKLKEERINIDLETLKNRLLIGVLSDEVDSLMYLDNLSLNNGNIKTKVIEIDNDSFDRNRNMLSMLDCIFISNMDCRKLSDGLNLAIENFVKDGKVVFLGTGSYGNTSFPNAVKKYLYGPAINDTYEYDFSKFISKNHSLVTLDSTIYKLIGNNPLYTYDNVDCISTLAIGSGVVCNCTFSFNDIGNYISEDNTFIVKLIEDTMGNNRLNVENYGDNNISYNDYYSIKSLIDAVDHDNLPNIFYYIVILSVYIFVITIVLYTVLRSANAIRLYPLFVGIIAILTSIIIIYVIKDTRRTGTFLTYSSVVEIDKDDSKETAFFNFRTLDSKDYSFNTSNNNILYPMLQNTNEPIVINDDFSKKKNTTFITESNVIYVTVENAENFEPSIFMYQNRNVDTGIYDIDASVKLYDGGVIGRITNKMDTDVKDASIIAYGKVIFVGDIKAKTSITLNNAKVFNAPISNNSMISELMCYYPRTKLAKYYLDNNIYQYYDGAKFIGFVSDINTLSYDSYDINSKTGETMIVKSIVSETDDNKKVDTTSLKHSVKNIAGQYDNVTNTIDGDSEVINTYTFDNNIDIEKIYIENLTDFDVGKIDYNVAFYGNIYMYNYRTNQYDQVLDNAITKNIKNYINNDNSIMCRFVPTNRDILYRRISLPQIRAIGIIK